MTDLRSKHEEYRRSRAALGYVYGEVIDDAAMTDPFLTDFDQLSEEAKQAFEQMMFPPLSLKPKKSAPRAKKAAKTAKDTGEA